MAVAQSNAGMVLVVTVSKQTSIHSVFNSFSAWAAFLAPFFLPSGWNLVVLHCSDVVGLNFRQYEATVLLWFGTYKHPAAALYPEPSGPAERTVFFFYCFIASVNKATTETRGDVVAPAESGKKEEYRYEL